MLQRAEMLQEVGSYLLPSIRSCSSCASRPQGASAALYSSDQPAGPCRDAATCQRLMI